MLNYIRMDVLIPSISDLLLQQYYNHIFIYILLMLSSILWGVSTVRIMARPYALGVSI